MTELTAEEWQTLLKLGKRKPSKLLLAIAYIIVSVVTAFVNAGLTYLIFKLTGVL